MTVRGERPAYCHLLVAGRSTVAGRTEVGHRSTNAGIVYGQGGYTPAVARQPYVVLPPATLTSRPALPLRVPLLGW